MLRAFLIYLSQSERLRRIAMNWSLSRHVASRFVAGDSLEEAVEEIEELERRGLLATLDHLGEHVTTPEEADRATEDYLALVETIEARDLQAGLSLKLTQLGLEQDFEACTSRLRAIVERARESSIFVRIDMEHSAVVDDTFHAYRKIREQDLVNLGVVIQSYLYRSEDDMRDLLDEGARIRLVKGAYDEPPEIAYPNKRDVDVQFDALARMMIDTAIDLDAEPVSEDGRTPPLVALGTHDARRIEAAKAYAKSMGLPKKALEIQLLFGIRAELGRSLAEEGYPVRVYVPYGTEWYPYFMRRLAERPANLWFFLRQLVQG